MRTASENGQLYRLLKQKETMEDIMLSGHIPKDPPLPNGDPMTADGLAVWYDSVLASIEALDPGYLATAARLVSVNGETFTVYHGVDTEPEPSVLSEGRYFNFMKNLGLVIPRKIRIKAFLPAIEDLKLDYLEHIAECKSPFIRKLKCAILTMHGAYYVVVSLGVWIGDFVKNVVEPIRKIIKG